MKEKERALAHIEKIEWIRPIEGADAIELCGVLGWSCVIAKKDNFKVGDKIIYCEIDSVLPDKEQYEFLRSRNFRIRTIKLKGQVSQGLILPLHKDVIKLYSIGQDVTEELGITKYLTPSEREEISQNEKKIANEKNKLKKFMMRYSWFRKWSLSSKQKAGFPYWVSKTDEERIQNIPKVLETYTNKVVYITEKIDYQSVTFTGKMVPRFPILGKLSPKKYKFVVCSRNLTTNDKNSLYWKIAIKYDIERILRENPSLTIQGEQGDTNIQGNKYKITEPKLWVFNIYDHEKHYHYSYMQMLDFCMKYNLHTVPYLGMLKLLQIGTTVEEIVNYAKGTSTVYNTKREGVVIRLIEDGKKIMSFKAINPEFFTSPRKLIKDYTLQPLCRRVFFYLRQVLQRSTIRVKS